MTRLTKNSALYLVPTAIFFLLAPLSLSAGSLFTPVQLYNSGGLCAKSIAIADLNGDGKSDLVVVNSCGGSNNSGSVSVFLGNGDGTFQPPMTYGGVYQSISVVLADVNGDGKLDLVVANNCSNDNCDAGSVGVLLGNGDGTFQSPLTYSSGGLQPKSVAVADFNGDAKPDIVVVNTCLSSGCPDRDGVVGVLLGNGDGTFQAVNTYDSGGQIGGSVAVGNLNGDGTPDLVVANNCSGNSCSNGSVSMLLGNGDGTFQAPVQLWDGYPPLSVTVADVNGDHVPDLLLTINNGTVGILFGNGDGSFQSVVLYKTGGFIATSIALADVNGDGKRDLLVGTACVAQRKCGFGGEVNVLLGNGDGTFIPTPIHSYSLSTLTPLGPTSMTVAYLNGKLDVVVAGCLAENCANSDVGVLLGTARLYTTTNLNSNPNPSTYGQAVTLTATVSSAGPNGATGKVTFKNGTKTVGTATLGGGVATLTTKKLPVGTLSLTAAYGGDLNLARSTSAVLVQVVNPAAR